MRIEKRGKVTDWIFDTNNRDRISVTYLDGKWFLELVSMDAGRIELSYMQLRSFLDDMARELKTFNPAGGGL